MTKGVGFTLFEMKQVVGAQRKKQNSKSAKIEVLHEKMLQIDENERIKSS